MADRVVSVRLKIEVDEARRNSRTAANALLGVADAAERAGRSSNAAMAGIQGAVRGTVKSISTLGAVTAGGMAVLTASTVKTGISYNTLEQTSRAALKTVLGSAAAATSQMEQLREFGKTSPFPRQVWISAQQQLLAFGMSAEKIIPTFQAIQDAVAAAGGGSQQIAEITQIIAKIQSTGRVTAEELNELGYRGIDAASLIGEAMGKTAGEVRADIQAQAISGVQFIDMLTGAMSERFEGAAAGVKQTWAGATDRVKGALRDIGGLLATPLVDPNGGGAAVDWANALADALRALETRLQPVMDSLGERAGPIFDNLTAKLEALANWIKTADFSRIGDQVRSMLPAIAGVTAGLSTMALSNLPYLDKLVGGLKPLPVALASAALASPELRRALLDLLTAAEPLISAVANLGGILAASLGPALNLVASLLQPVVAVVGFLADRFEELPGPVQTVIAALGVLGGLQLAGKLSGITTALTNFRSEMDAQRKYADMAGTSVTSMGAAYSVGASKVSGAANGIRGALQGAIGFLGGPWGAAIGLGITALSAFSMAQEAASGSASAFTYEIDTQTGALTRASIASLYNHIATEAKVLGDESARVSEILPELGLSVDDVVGYLMGEEAAIGRVNNALKVNNSWSRQLQNWLEKQSGAIAQSSKTQINAANSADKYAGATEGAAGASEKAAGAAAGLAGSMYGVGDAADSVAARTQQLQGIMSGLFDAQFGLQKAQDDFQGGLHSLKAAFAVNDKGTQKAASSADKYGDSLKRQQKILRDTQKQLKDLAESQREAEKEAAEAAANARQRQLDEMFGNTFNVQATLDAFRSGLAQAGKDIADARKDGAAGIGSLTGFSEGALSNRDRMRSLVQQAQAAIQAERDRGASQTRINQVAASLAGELSQQASAWGLNTAEVKQYTDAITAFGNLAGSKVVVDLRSVKEEFAEQRREIQENSAEQMENARQSASTAAASMGASSAVERHTAALQGNSESAIKNREMMRQVVKQAQDELTQMHLNGATKEELTAKGEELAGQLMRESVQLGFTEEDVRQYTKMIQTSAQEIARYPQLNARANVAGAMTTVQNFVAGVNKQLAKIKKNFEIGVVTGSEYINSMGGGRQFATNADGGLIRGQGGPREDNILSWVSNGEFVVNARDTARNRGLLEVINQGGDVKQVGAFARGGYVDPINLNFKGRPSTGLQQLYDGIMGALMGTGGIPIGPASGAALGWAASQAGKPYIWGGVGPGGYDCSGFMSAITNVIQGRNPHSRRFATGSFPTGDFLRGPGNFMIGSRRGNPGHMAGTLKGVNVESRGSDGVVIGRRARGAFDSLFNGNVWHLKGYRDGGMVSGDPPFDLLSPMGLHFKEILGSYARGTDYVPMDGLYELHRGEAVTPATQNRGGAMVLEGRLQSDGTKFGDLVTDSLNKGISTGQIRLVRK